MDDVEARLAALEARVAALEPASASTPEAGDVFWALNGLKERGGGVLYTGAVDVGEYCRDRPVHRSA